MSEYFDSTVALSAIFPSSTKIHTYNLDHFRRIAPDLKVL